MSSGLHGSKVAKGAALSVVLGCAACADAVPDPVSPRLPPPPPSFVHGGSWSHSWEPWSNRCLAYSPPSTYWGTPTDLCDVEWSVVPLTGPILISGLIRGPFTVTFSKPVSGLVVEGNGAYDCRGSYGEVRATTVSGQTVSVPFINPFPGDCGTDEISGTLLAAIPSTQGVTTAIITSMSPATFELPDPWRGYFGNSYATYHLSFDRYPSCELTGDPVLDAPDAGKVIDELLALSNIDGPLSGRRERSAVAWQNVLTNTVRFEISPREGSRCGTPIAIPSDTEQEKVVGLMHTHPHHRGDDMTGCKVGADRYQPEANGGGSREDWGVAKQFGIDVYAISPDVVHRLPWETNERDRPKNRKRWKRAAAGCAKSY
jgi:hypothetical protein